MSSALTVQQFSFGLEYIRGHFGSNTALATQQATHNLYRTNREPLVDHILRCLDLTGNESVLDLGCGNGFVLRDVVSRLRAGGRAVAVDISPAMLELAQQNVTVCWVPLEFVEGRAESLPQYADGEFDRIMANFIFHYIEEPDLVCAQIKRLLDPRGRALVSIEARNSMSEMYRMHFAAMEKVGFPAEFIERLPQGRRGKMVLDNAREILSRHFSEVEERPYQDCLRFENVEPFMSFYADGHRYCGAMAMAGADIPEARFKQLHAEVEKTVTRRIDEVGYFELQKQNSVFVCA
jgi:ubiquinone/menaquinone biosynthesis C-methylase UbiE